ncbi:MAG: hypothetical protein JNM28_02190 [Armatimonadetes bacterium]|nr:hypothetical protein [Armatimonadota bacterium]MBS1711900.1 hypothetical protein [Armatimonadota bacterium]MBX3109546.1 hypothetical protein [Fimbriimonadaceae bacterium]
MSEAKRAYNLLRSFVNQEWERVKGFDMNEAWKELNENPAEAEARRAAPEAKQPDTTMDATELEATARTILNVTAKASYDEIRKSYEKVSNRVQPQNFDSGTEEARQAQELLRKATWAYQYLTKDMSPVQRRFRSLEIE